MGNYQQPAGDDITKIGALAEGFANTSTNDSDVDDSNVGVGNGGNRDNTYTDNSQSLDVDAKLQVATDNGDNRDNSYDWDYDSKTSTYNDNDTNSNNKTTNINDADTSVKSDYDWSYDSKSYSDNDTTVITHTDTDTKTSSYSSADTDTKTTTDSFNESFSKSDTDFATLEDVKDIGNLGVASGDIAFNLGDDFSFSLNVDNILNDSLNGAGNDSAFSLVQASHLADQDSAYNVQMNNQDAMNDLTTTGGTAHGAEGIDMDGKGWDLKAGDDAVGSSTANASSILANSGYHLELVQGANLMTNSFEGSVIGGDSHHVGEDAGS